MTFWLCIFYFFNIGIFALLVFRENRRNPLLYASVASLMVLPFIRIGTSQDFCWRSTIPANCMLFCFLARGVLTKGGMSAVRKYAVACVFGLCLVNGGAWNMMFTARYAVRNHFKPYIADSIYTFSDKTLDGRWDYLNFIDTNPGGQFFYTVLAKKKSAKTILKDAEKTRQLQSDRNLALIEGRYVFSPKLNPGLFLSATESSKIPGYNGGKDLALSAQGSQISVQIRMCEWDERDRDFVDGDKYRIAFYPDGQVGTKWDAPRLDIPWGKVEENGGIGVCPPNSSDAQKFRIVRVGDFYKIVWDGHALTVADDGTICMRPDEGLDTQLWQIQPYGSTTTAQ